MDNFITRTEAAKILGVTPQSVSNYIEKGLLVSRRKGNVNTFVTVSEESVYKLKDEEMSHGIDMESVNAHIREVEELNAKAVEEERFISEYLGKLDIINISTLLPRILEIFAEFNDDDRQCEVIKKLCAKATIAEIAEDLGLTKERVRQMTVRILMTAARNTESYTLVCKENEELRVENARLKFENEKLKTVVSAVHTEQKVDACCSGWKLKNVKISDTNMSGRLVKVLEQNGVKTVYDLASLHKEDLLKMNQFGRKSLHEIDEFFLDNNLTYGCVNC